MPLPTPTKGESRQQFMDRCMADPVILRDFDQQDQRVAVCMRQWNDHPADRKWYEIRAEADAAEVRIYDEIGGWGITAADFVDALAGVEAGIINLHINSPGGEVFDGIAIYNALKSHPARVNVTIDSLAASSASFIAQAGDHVAIAKGGTMMIHEPYGLVRGTAADAAKMAEALGKFGDNIAEIYADRAGGAPADWRQRMEAETWYRAQEAVDAHLADEVITPGRMAAAARYFNLSRFKNVPDWLPENVGRKASQSTLDHMHTALQDMQAAHDQVCDMGDNCPVSGDGMSDRIRNAEWDTAWINNLPDSAFAYIAPGGSKDDSGKTVPRSLRYLPHHGSGGAVDLPHLRNALSRAPQTDLPAAAKATAIRHLQSHAQQEGVGEGQDHAH